MFRTTTMRRAIAEAVAIFTAGQLLAFVPPTFWPDLLFPLVLIVRLAATFILPPYWATMRVKSTRREKMSRRFWRLGPILAAYCTLAATLLALVLGETLPFGGRAGLPDLARFGARGSAHLAVGSFAFDTLKSFVGFAIYYTIAVVCTRLANGGFLRFTMPAGKGRVTL